MDELFAAAISTWIATSSHLLKRPDQIASDVAKVTDWEEKNDIVGKNDLVAKNDIVEKNDLVTKGDIVGKNDLVVKNDLVAKDDLEIKNDKVAEDDLVAKNDMVNRGKKRGDGEEAKPQGHPKKVPRRSRLEVWYKGRFRRAADGLGKCSPGIHPPSSRPRSQSQGAKKLASAFWDEVLGVVDSLPKQERLRLISNLVLGRYETSPFQDKIQPMKEKLDQLVVSLGKKPGRRKGDRDTEIHFRRLKAWAELVEDEDHLYLHTMAARGVPIGARGEIGRISEVYDPKTKGDVEVTPPVWGEDFQSSERDNYRSATEHLDKVKKHVEEDVKKGWVVQMSKEEAEKKFKDELQIASLGAVPKDQQWSDVRVVHDGTHGIQVNSRIVQPNKMEFPQFDDLHSVLRSFQLDDPGPKLLCAFDIKSAHRLIPIQPEDWGLLRWHGLPSLHTGGLHLLGVDGSAFILEEDKRGLHYGMDWLYGGSQLLVSGNFITKGRMVVQVGEIHQFGRQNSGS